MIRALTIFWWKDELAEDLASSLSCQLYNFANSFNTMALVWFHESVFWGPVFLRYYLKLHLNSNLAYQVFLLPISRVKDNKIYTYILSKLHQIIQWSSSLLNPSRTLYLHNNHCQNWMTNGNKNYYVPSLKGNSQHFQQTIITILLLVIIFAFGVALSPAELQ